MNVVDGNKLQKVEAAIRRVADLLSSCRMVMPLLRSDSNEGIQSAKSAH